MKATISVLLCLLSSYVICQRKDIDTSKMIQLSGVVVSEEDLAPMPYITVYDKSIRKGVFADYYGFFSMVFQEIQFVFHILDTRPRLT